MLGEQTGQGMPMGMHALAVGRDEAVVCNKIYTGGAEAHDGVAPPRHAGADRAAHVVAGAAGDRQAGTQAPPRAQRRAQFAADRAAVDQARQLLDRDPAGRDDRARPKTCLRIHQQRRRCISAIGNRFSGEAEADVILGQQNILGARDRFRLMTRKP